MLTGEIRTQIDAVWNAFWSGGIANPLEVIEQITYLLFLRRLDDLHTLEESKSATLHRQAPCSVSEHHPSASVSSTLQRQEQHPAAAVSSTLQRQEQHPSASVSSTLRRQ